MFSAEATHVADGAESFFVCTKLNNLFCSSHIIKSSHNLERNIGLAHGVQCAANCGAHVV